MDYVPKSLRISSQKLSGFQRNRFRLENLGSSESGPGKICSVNLPSDCLIDSQSIKLHADCLCTSSGAGGTQVHGRLPASSMSLISRLEVYVNGVAITQGAAEYNTICRMLKIPRCSRDRDGSIDRSLSHGAIIDANAPENASLVFSDFPGVLSECSARYLPTHIMGNIQIRLTFADESVLVPRLSGGGTIDTAIPAGAATAAAAAVSYSLSNMYWTVDTISLDDQYDQMLRARLQSQEFIQLNYKEYLSFSNDGHAGGSHQTRFQLSTQSLDRLYAVTRNGNYRTRGLVASGLPESLLTDNSYTANHFRFKSFDAVPTRSGNVRTQWRINNVLFPQAKQASPEELWNLAYVSGKSRQSDQGNLVTGMQNFNDGNWVSSLLLCEPSEPLSTVSGLDSRGVNTSLVWDVSGQTPPGGGDTVSSFVVAETTATLRIGLSQSLLPVF